MVDSDIAKKVGKRIPSAADQVMHLPSPPPDSVPDESHSRPLHHDRERIAANSAVCGSGRQILTARAEQGKSEKNDENNEGMPCRGNRLVRSCILRIGKVRQLDSSGSKPNASELADKMIFSAYV